jgi:hypothetical protein
MRASRCVSDTFSMPKMDSSFSGARLCAHEVGGMDEHAARPAGEIEDAPVIRLDDLDDQPNNALGV